MTEIRDILKKMYNSMESGDPDFMKKIFSKKDDGLVIGSDPKEWWFGYDKVTEAFAKQAEILPKAKFTKTDPKISVEGPVGWFSDNVSISIGEGSVDMRLSGIFRKEVGDWKLAQMHASIGVPNADTDFGDVDLM